MLQKDNFYHFPFFLQFKYFLNFYWSKKGNISYKIESAERAPHCPKRTTQIFLVSLATVAKRLNRSY